MEMEEAKNESSRCLVCYLPWSGIDNELTVGPVTFWPFRKLERTKIADPDIRCFLGRYFDSYIDWMGDVEDGITLVCHTRDDFREFSNEEKGMVQEAVNWISFSAMGHGLVESAVHFQNARGSLPTVPNGDHFQLHWKTFDPKDQFISVNEEGVIAGFSLGRIRFPRPFHVPNNNYRYAPNTDILTSLCGLIGKVGHEKLRARINRALDWFLMSRSGGSVVSPMTRATMLMTAFEILLDFPDGSGQKRKYFADKMEAIISVTGLKILPITLGKPPSLVNYRMPGAWAAEFYQLRSAITHGDELTSAQWKFEGLPILGLGHVLFVLALLQELWNSGLVPVDDLGFWKEMAHALNEPDLEKQPRPQFHPWIEQVYTGIGWLGDPASP